MTTSDGQGGGTALVARALDPEGQILSPLLDISSSSVLGAGVVCWDSGKSLVFLTTAAATLFGRRLSTWRRR